ncbi:hypothetical protein D9Q98_003401 [Chlorella vulgaris]|uniref:Uncharacterized protein n=1 Tax=Chlorella vulgaris TaxID=3077 RepID=A0A9D4TSX0_CHLVU|nr:hypothetical protein D9Q98_003401 [Chlorella vulgaris]
MQADHAPSSSAAHKRAGSWLLTDLDLDAYRTSKRFKTQDIAGDLARGMSLESGSKEAAARSGRSAASAGSGGSGSGSGGSATAAPAASTGSLPDSFMLCSAEGSPAGAAAEQDRRQQAQQQQAQQQQVQQAHQQQAAQHTPHSDTQTPRARSAGELRPRPTPMRLYDTLSLHPTSPSDPGLEGQLDLRKATLMRRLQSRLRADTGDAPGSPPCIATGMAGAVAATHEDLQCQPQEQHPPQQHQQPPQQLSPGAAMALTPPHGRTRAASSPPDAAAADSTVSSMQLSHRSAPLQHCGGPPALRSALCDTGCSAMLVSPPPVAR